MNECYICGGPLNEHACRHCGATRQINPVSGNIMWVGRNGKVLAAFQDEKEQWVKMAKKHNIPESQWPDRFKTE